MTEAQPDRIYQIEALLAQFIAASERDRASSNERMTRLEETMASDRASSNERMTRLELRSERTDARFNQLAEQQELMLAELDANREITFTMLGQLTVLEEDIKRLLDGLFGQQPNGKS